MGGSVTPRSVVVILGTRPEAIKLAPLIRVLRAKGRTLRVQVVSTGQHHELLHDALSSFGIVPDVDLALMRPAQSPAETLSRCLAALAPVLDSIRPEVIVVQGDTSTTLAGALAGHYARVPVAHVEAGVRSGDSLAPFPEEQHRRLVDSLARWLFAPTETARQNLLREGYPNERIHVTGNTGIDALRWLERQAEQPEARARLDAFLEGHGVGDRGRPSIVATLHRREQQGAPLRDVCRGLAALAASAAVDVILPVHPSPAVREAVESELRGTKVCLVPALDPIRFIGLLRRAALVVTDSGGVQEEAAALGVPALVVRSRSDRPEAIEAGVSRLVGHDPIALVEVALRILDEGPLDAGARAKGRELFGDGRAATRIADVLSLAET